MNFVLIGQISIQSQSLIRSLIRALLSYVIGEFECSRREEGLEIEIQRRKTAIVLPYHEGSNLVATECPYDIRSRNHRRSYTPGGATSSEKSDTKLTRRNSKVQEENIETIKEKDKERPMTGSVRNNQNTKSVEQKYAGIIPCKVLISDYLYKEKKKNDPWGESGSVCETYKRTDRLWNVRRRLIGKKLIWISVWCLLVLGSSYIIRYLFSPAIHDASKNVTDEFLTVIKMNENESRQVEEKLIDNNVLLNRMEAFEKEQMYQKEYLTNITRILEDYKERQDDLRKEFNDINTDIADKMNISGEPNNIINNELKMIRHELEKLRNFSAKLESSVNNYIKIQVEEILSDYFYYFPFEILKKNITENVLRSCSIEAQAVLNNDSSDSSTRISEEHVRKIVKDILRIYDADRTGKVDYALESAGGEIISTRNTQGYDVKSKVISILGFPLYYRCCNNNPRTVIQMNVMQPGICWAFQNFPGYLLIRLRSIIYVTGFTLEHIPRIIIPSGNMSSAPRNFNVWGLTDENDPKPVIFGDYEFVNSDDNLQYFPVQNTTIDRPYEYVELRIHSNHGQLDYTCLYKFRVHGIPT
ncbi:PREDICTED: SUN domain-containing protein 1-like isoform X4 [Dinoponera quadriceps]|uniref:SUN domain-containing protein 1-like isoform X4 n=1 Tax=Dinoponera quadriceps TaxID=609295 RepID=A0A6P3YE30_DINQU|nr:PREDICTED: SUN domain-containing protein 1-like isoform X4 [Dinoponera quadriceps]